MDMKANGVILRRIDAISGRFLCKRDPGKTAAFASLISREYENTMARLTRAA